jgi:hypothetical protein
MGGEEGSSSSSSKRRHKVSAAKHAEAPHLLIGDSGLVISITAVCILPTSGVHVGSGKLQWDAQFHRTCITMTRTHSAHGLRACVYTESLQPPQTPPQKQPPQTPPQKH